MIKSISERLSSRLSARSDSEHEQALVRLLVGALLFLYLLPKAFYGDVQRADVLMLFAMVCYMIFASAIFGWIYLLPASSPPRRVCGAVLDIGAVTFFMFNTGEYGAPLYIVYLLIIFGHGFRYGKPYLYNTLVLSVAGFAVVLASNRYWMENRTFGVGLMVGMILLSLYVGKHVTRLFDSLRREEAAN